MEETKTCSKCCGEFPATDEYFKRYSTSRNLSNICKACEKRDAKLYYETHKEKMKQDARDNYAENRESRVAQKKEYYQNNKDKVNKAKREWERRNKDKVAAQRKEWKKNNAERFRLRIERYNEVNRDAIEKRRKEYYEKNREILLEQKKEYYERNKEQILDYKKEYYIENADKIKHYKCVFRVRNREKIHAWQKRRYLAEIGLPATLTLSQWEGIKTVFDNKCCYCGKQLPLEQDHFIALSKGGEYTLANIVPACKSCNSSKKDKHISVWYPKQSFYSKEREGKILKHIGIVTKLEPEEYEQAIKELAKELKI